MWAAISLVLAFITPLPPQRPPAFTPLMAASEPAAAAPPPSKTAAEPCNVVLTHTNADFDSLAGAVALAKLWSVTRPELPSHVVMPRGVNPLVNRFLAYHKHLLPVRGFKTIREEDIVAIGVVDCNSRDRLGPGASWVEAAEHIVIVDHHMSTGGGGKGGDIEPDELLLEPVGSATTVIVERLRALIETPDPDGPKLKMTETEATLFALGIRADTGQLSFPTTTPRDAYALAWLMEHGCSQSAIAEFGQARLGNQQRDLLSKAMDEMRLAQHEGLKLGWVALDTGRGFVTGMASVAEELLQLLACDVVFIGVIHTNAKKQPFLSLIGRCSARAEGRKIDLNEILQNWKGGGHPAAAAASIKLRTGEVVPRDDATKQPPSSGGEAVAVVEAEDEEAVREREEEEAREEAYWVMQQAVAMLVKQVPEQVRASDLMTKSIIACKPTDSMDDTLALMNKMRKRAVPVCSDDGEMKLLGFIKYRDPIKAAQSGKGHQNVKAWMRKEYMTVEPDTPFTEMEELLLEGSTGRLHVVDDDGRLIGLVSRTDVLRHYDHYKTLGQQGEDE